MQRILRKDLMLLETGNNIVSIKNIIDTVFIKTKIW